MQEDSQALVGDAKAPQAASLHSPAEMEELQREVQGVDATLRAPGGAVSTQAQQDADSVKSSAAQSRSSAADSDINFMPKLSPVRTYMRTTAGKHEKPQPPSTLEWKPSKPAKSAMKSGLSRSGENQGTFSDRHKRMSTR